MTNREIAEIIMHADWRGDEPPRHIGDCASYYAALECDCERDEVVEEIELALDAASSSK